MSESNLQAVQRIYQAFGEGDVATIMELLDDDIDFATEVDKKVAPWQGRRSKAEVPAFFEALGATLEVTRFEPLSFTSNDTDVMVVIRFGFTVRANGRSGEMQLHHWWRFREGKVILYRGTEDTALTAELLA